MNIAIVGATGLVGRKMIDVLGERNFSAQHVYLFASEKSAGRSLYALGKRRKVCVLTPDSPRGKKIDIALFSAGKAVSLMFAPIFVEHGAVVIDNSSAFRMQKGVPLVVPEVNPEDIPTHRGIIANPNCSTIQAAVVLKALDDYKKIKRVSFTTFQAVSGAGQKGVEDLKKGMRGEVNQKFPRQIFSNCIPQVDDFGANGYTFEEDKMINETRKILHHPRLAVTATCVRVPVFNCHSEVVNVEFSERVDIDYIEKILASSRGIRFYKEGYPTALDADGSDSVFVGRLRRDYSVESGVTFWCVADNLRKGAAANAVQIAEIVAKLSNNR